MVRNVVFVVTAAMIATTLYWQVDILHRGGPVMIPIVMCSIFSLTFIIERFAYFLGLHLGTDIDQRFQALREAVEERRWKEAETLCSSWNGPVAEVVLAGLSARDVTDFSLDAQILPA